MSKLFSKGRRVSVYSDFEHTQLIDTGEIVSETLDNQNDRWYCVLLDESEQKQHFQPEMLCPIV